MRFGFGKLRGGNGVHKILLVVVRFGEDEPGERLKVLRRDSASLRQALSQPLAVLPEIKDEPDVEGADQPQDGGLEVAEGDEDEPAGQQHQQHIPDQTQIWSVRVQVFVR